MKITIDLNPQTTAALRDLAVAWTEYIKAIGGTGEIDCRLALSLFVSAYALTKEAELRRALTKEAQLRHSQPVSESVNIRVIRG